MTITSVGYAGSITDANWRRMATASIGSLYGVDDFESWKVTAGVGDRALSIAPGGAFGLGVRDYSDAPISVTANPVPSGSRWDLVVARRDWGTKTTTGVVIQGSGTRELPSRNVGFGTANDQPIALVRFSAGQSAAQDIIDLRCIPGDGGIIAFDDLARSYLDRVGTSVRIGNTRWSRVVDAFGSPAWEGERVATDTGWQTLTLGPGWSSYTGRPARIRRVGQVVTLQGQIVPGNGSSYDHMATIPSGYRPSTPGDIAYVGVALGTPSPVFSLALAVSASGLLIVPAGARGAVNPETVVLSGSWITD